jgi:hypothetical protein
MAEFEELRIGVSLSGDAATQLAKYNNLIKQTASGETARHTEGINKQVNVLNQGLKLLGLNATGTGEKLVQLTTRLGATASAVGALAAAYVIAAKKVGDFAIEMNKTSRAAEEIGTTLGQKMNFRQQLAAMGRSYEESDKLLAQSIKLGQEARQHSIEGTFRELELEMKVGGRNFAMEFRQALIGAQGDPAKQFNVILEYHEKIRDLVKESSNYHNDDERRAATAKYQEVFRTRIGITEQLAGLAALHSLDKERAAFWERMDTNSKAVAASTNVIYANFKAILTVLESGFLDPEASTFPAFLKTVRDLTQDLLTLMTEAAPDKIKLAWQQLWWDLLPHGSIDKGSAADWMLQHLRHRLPGTPDIPIPYTPAERPGAPDLAKSLGLDAIGGKENTEKKDENTKQLKELNHNLYQLLNPTGDLSYMGGGDRASGESYDTSSTGAGRHPGSYTPATETPATPATPPAPANVPKPATIETIPSPGAVKSPGSPFDPFMPTSPSILGPTTAAPSNPGGAFDEGVNTNVLGYLHGISGSESSHQESEAYSEVYNNHDPDSRGYNKNVRKYGKDAADNG